MNQKRAQDYELPVNPNKLGCIMLDFDPLPVRQWTIDSGIERKAPTGIFAYDKTGSQPWVQGPVAEKGSHATLLYGLVTPLPQTGHAIAGQFYRQYVDTLLEDLELVDHHFAIRELDVFENPDYDVVVGRLDSTLLNEANRRLRFLPHIDTFADYKAHITLAYVEKGTGAGFSEDIWSKVIFEADLVGKAINYGGEFD